MSKFLALLIFASLASCAEDDSFMSGGSFEKKPKSQVDTSELAQASSNGKKAAEIVFNISLDTRNAQLCQGQAELVIMENFTLDIARAPITCLSLEIDLAGMLDSAGGAGEDENLLEKASHDGKMLYLEELAGATFSPARPLILGPIITNNSKYRGYSNSIDSNVTVDGKTTPGTFNVDVIDHETTLETPAGDFIKIIDWKLATEGFKGVAATDGLIFRELHFYWNTRPIMLPKLVIKGDLSNFIGGDTDGLLGGVVDAIVGSDSTLYKWMVTEEFAADG